MSSLSGNNDVELVGSVDGSRKATCSRVVRVADVSDDTVEYKGRLCSVLDGSDVVRQTDEERNTPVCRC